MEYAAIGLCFIAIIAIGVVIYKRKRNETSTEDFVSNTAIPPSADSADDYLLATPEDVPPEIPIHTEMLPAEIIPVGSKLTEITDSRILAHIDQLVPNFAQAANAVNIRITKSEL